MRLLFALNHLLTHTRAFSTLWMMGAVIWSGANAGCDSPAPKSLQESPTHASASPLPQSTAPTVTIDVMKHASAMPYPLPQAQQVRLSDFAQANQKKVIRVNMDIRTTRIGRIAGEDIEDRIWNMLTAHTPEPFELRRAKKSDPMHDAWASLNIQFKRSSERLRKTSKTAPQRTRASFDISVDLGLPRNMTSSWAKFSFKFRDEHYADEDQKVNQAFWKALKDKFPTLTVAAEGEPMAWARSQGLITTRLSNDIAETLSFPEHQYYPEGCIAYQKAGQTYIAPLHTSASAHRPLSVSPVLSLSCSRDATFVFSQSTQNDVELHYQPMAADHSWKTGIHFETPVTRDNFGHYIDDDMICLWNGEKLSDARKSEIHCLDRKTGLPRWKTLPQQGMVRAFAATPNAMTFVMDQAAFSVSRDGDLLYVHRLAPIQSRINERRSCQNESTLAFSINPAQLLFMDIATGEFNWVLNTFNTENLHCGLDNIIVFTEAGGYLLGVNASTLQPLWKYRPASMPRDFMTFGSSLILLMDRAMIVLQLTTGRQLAAFPLPVMATKLIRLGNRIFLDTPSSVHPLRVE